MDWAQSGFPDAFCSLVLCIVVYRVYRMHFTLYFDAVIIANVVVVVVVAVAFSRTCCLFFNITQGQHLVSIKTLQLVVTKRAQKNISSRTNLINNRQQKN